MALIVLQIALTAFGVLSFSRARRSPKAQAVRWYCKYGVSYRDLETMLAERGVSVDHSTIYWWVQRYAPEIEKRLRWYWKRPSAWRSWRVDETYIKVIGKWVYLYRPSTKMDAPSTFTCRQRAIPKP